MGLIITNTENPGRNSIKRSDSTFFCWMLFAVSFVFVDILGIDSVTVPRYIHFTQHLTPISSILSILGRISSLSATHVQFLISTLGGWMWQIIFHVCNNRWLSSVCQAPGHNNIMVRDDKQNCYHTRITDAGHWNSFKPPPIGTKSTRPLSITTGYK